MPELTILMPCLNEVRTLGVCILKAKSFFARAGIDGEVLVADNGSVDGSQALARSLGARVVDVPERGYGAALIGGIKAAAGRYVVMGDADDSYDFERLDGFLERLRAGDQLVMGNRFAGGIARGAMPWHHRYIGNPILSFIGRQLFKTPVRDFHCGLRGFDRNVILGLGLRSTGMEFASEMVVKATLAGLRVAEVPTTLKPDGRDRAPHLRSFRDGWRHLRFLLLHCPRWLFLYPGLALLVSGVVLQVALIPAPLPLGDVVLDVHTMLFAAAAGILGLQVCLFWVLSHVAAWRLGDLPDVPAFVRWLVGSRIEIGMVVGLVLMFAGLLYGGYAVVQWAEVGFHAIDPSRVMRWAIPSVTLMMAGGEVFFASFFLGLLAAGGARRCLPNPVRVPPPRASEVNAADQVAL